MGGIGTVDELVTTCTEETAKQSYCPISMGSGGDLGYCRASGCMAWRWAVVHRSGAQHIWRGYCGMAGAPLTPAKIGEAAV